MAGGGAYGSDVGGPGAGSPQAQVAPLPPWLAILPPELWRKQKDYFGYHLDFTPLAASATAAQSISITADADFIIIYGTRIVTATDNTTFVSSVPELVTLVDTGAGRSLTSSPVHMDELFGTAQLPSYWAYPKLIRAGASITVTLQNLEATARNVRMTLHGFKIFSQAQ